MANLAETPSFDPVPQIETNTVWKGGVDGPANNQGKALANRTLFLKNLFESLGAASELVAGKVELATPAETIAGLDTTRATHPAGVKAAIAAAIAAILDSTPGTLDTLNELAAALGDDPNFSTTMLNALAGKVAISALASKLEAEAGIDNTKWMSPLRVAESIAANAASKQLQSVTASVSGNALTLGLNPTSLDFRSAALSNGVPNNRKVAAPLSLVVPAGATLGTINGQQARIVLLALDVAGTVELAVVNLAGGNNLDETTLISTTAISGASNSAGVIYSTTPRANVPFRIVSITDTTQAAAGTWASAPTLVQGIGGQALAAMSSLGYGQSWQDVTGSRSLGTTYYNITGKPIIAHVSGTQTAGSGAAAVNFTVNGVTLAGCMTYGNTDIFAANVVVPVGASYSAAVAVVGGTYSGISWKEMR